MIPRDVFTEEHDIFRESVRKFVATEIEPYHSQWEKDGVVSRDVWRKAGEAGLLCCSVPEIYGGPEGSLLHSTVVIEELARAGATGPAFHLHSEIVAPYILKFGTEVQKKEWLPPMVAGEVISAIAMTEPGAGSDVKAISSTAVRESDHYRINGQKVFISNGQIADLFLVAAKTNTAEGARGISLILVEADCDGFRRGRNLDKVGMKAQDTSELFFADVRVPIDNLIGDEDTGFALMMQQLAHERLIIALRCIASAEACIEQTISYTKERSAFGKPIFGFQNTRFKLADLQARITSIRVFIDRCLALQMENGLDAADAAKAKLLSSELFYETADECVQLYGGYGYMREFPIARAWADSRGNRIFGGTSEIMKEIISRDM